MWNCRDGRWAPCRLTTHGSVLWWLWITAAAQKQWVSPGGLFVMQIPPLGNNQTKPHNSTSYNTTCLTNCWSNWYEKKGNHGWDQWRWTYSSPRRGRYDEQQENPFSFQLNVHKTRQDIQPLCTGSWGLFPPSLFAYFCHSLLSISSFWCSFHHVPPSILPR